MSKKHPAGKAYEVGYGKPPKSGQFKPGQSGNPNGRPRAKKDVRSILHEVAFKRTTIAEQGKRRRVTLIEAHFMKLIQEALRGDPKASNQFNRLLPLLMTNEGADREGLSPGQIAELDKKLLAELYAQFDEEAPEAKTRYRKRRRRKSK